jgi:hypothetical protein
MSLDSWLKEMQPCWDAIDVTAEYRCKECGAGFLEKEQRRDRVGPEECQCCARHEFEADLWKLVPAERGWKFKIDRPGPAN